MDFLFCDNCGKKSGYKRAFGWGTFFAVIVTCGFWLLALPFYPRRCISCGNDSYWTENKLTDGERNFTDQWLKSKGEEIRKVRNL